MLRTADAVVELESAHHPFTAPHPEDAHLLATHPEKVNMKLFHKISKSYQAGKATLQNYPNKSFKIPNVKVFELSKGVAGTLFFVKIQRTVFFYTDCLGQFGQKHLG